MRDGFIKAAAATPDMKVGDTAYNTEQIISMMEKAGGMGVRLLVFPELGISGYTCGDLFLQDVLLEGCLKGLYCIKEASVRIDMVVVVGLPFLNRGRLYNVAAVLFRGKLLGLVPKKYIPAYSEFYESRHFAPAPEENETVTVRFPAGCSEYGASGPESCQVPFGMKLLFTADNFRDFVLAAEICEDLWMPAPPSSSHAIASATVIANLSASDETAAKASYRRELVKNQSARAVCGYVYADAGPGESSTDLVFAGHDLIAENGVILQEAARFENGMVLSELDFGKLKSERRRITSFPLVSPEEAGYTVVHFSFEELRAGDQTGAVSREGIPEKGIPEKTELPLTVLTRKYSRTPFVPGEKADRDERCDEILRMQAMGLRKRLAHTGCSTAVIGLSGGLDSTLALLVTVRAFDLLGYARSGIKAVTMPCFGTTDRTYQNACKLARCLGTSLQEIKIHNSVLQHFQDIGHDPEIQDVTYENAQARERTQVLMDIANAAGGLVIGTGDLSELALGWATYNGDHMSMYGVNASVPKTLVRYLVQYFAETARDQELGRVLFDVLDTPVSPELLPPKEGEIAQKTEDLVGPYELHDFFLYHMMRFGYMPSKVYRLACRAFEGAYEREYIMKWLQTFYRRFFAQQFKRSCLPDGPKVGSVALSPRGDWRMPSDASVRLWLEDLERMS